MYAIFMNLIGFKPLRVLQAVSSRLKKSTTHQERQIRKQQAREEELRSRAGMFYAGLAVGFLIPYEKALAFIWCHFC